MRRPGYDDVISFKHDGQIFTKKLMYGKRLEGLEDNRLVKIVAEKLKDAGNVGWWGEYGALQ